MYPIWLLIAHFVAAQTRQPLSDGAQTQLHIYLEDASEAMHKGDNAAAAEIFGVH